MPHSRNRGSENERQAAQRRVSELEESNFLL
jgi:hypothetical protein